MKNSLKDKLILIVIFVVAIYMFFATIYGTYKLFADDNIYIDTSTKTQYIEQGNYVEVKGTDGYTEYIGNNAELEF